MIFFKVRYPKLKLADNKATVLLALETLGSFEFDFEDQRVISLVNDCVILYLNHEDAVVSNIT